MVAKCRACGLVFPSPMPIPFDLGDHYGVLPEEYWKKEYFDVSNTYFAEVVTQFRHLSDFRTGMRALDIGAGVGKAMLALERAGFETHGFEASAPFRDRAIGLGLDPERLRLGDIESITYEADSFDFITFGAVLEHFYDPSGSIQKALQWLKPGGLIHIEVPSADWLIGRIVNLLYAMQASGYVCNLSPMHPPFHLYEFSLRSFQANSRRLGYELSHHEYFVCQTYMPRILDPLLRWCMRQTSTGMQLCVWLKKPLLDRA